MKAVILAGGLGTRLSEETIVRPKPMVEIGGRPILWHILKIYSQHGINDFIICCGYKGYIIKEYFANYFLHTSDVTFDMHSNKMTVHESVAEPWRVTLVDTGDSTGTGGRLKRISKYLNGDEAFCMTYGDGVTDDSQVFDRVPIEALVAQGEVQAFFHKGFWQAMDTLRDKQHLEELWSIGKAPWKTWYKRDLGAVFGASAASFLPGTPGSRAV